VNGDCSSYTESGFLDSFYCNLSWPERDVFPQVEKITEGKKRLRTVSKRLIDIQELERRHIARELHDEIGQSLTGLKIQLQTVQQWLPDPSMGLPVESGVQVLDRLMKQVRNLSLELRPSVLDDLGLQAALRW
jgi:signal transduction histidine kinase